MSIYGDDPGRVALEMAYAVARNAEVGLTLPTAEKPYVEVWCRCKGNLNALVRPDTAEMVALRVVRFSERHGRFCTAGE